MWKPTRMSNCLVILCHFNAPMMDSFLLSSTVVVARMIIIPPPFIVLFFFCQLKWMIRFSPHIAQLAKVDKVPAHEALTSQSLTNLSALSLSFPIICWSFVSINLNYSAKIIIRKTNISIFWLSAFLYFLNFLWKFKKKNMFCHKKNYIIKFLNLFKK